MARAAHLPSERLRPDPDVYDARDVRVRKLLGLEALMSENQQTLPHGRRRPANAMVFVPGLLCDARLWTGVQAQLEEEAHHIELDGAASLAQMADRILEAPYDRFILAGFSMGGMAALLAAGRAPERITGLAIISTHAERDTTERVQARRDQIAEVEAHGIETFVADRLLPAYFGRPPARREASALVTEMARAKAAGVFRAHVEALISRPDMAAAARAVRAPCVVLTGRDDTIAPPDLARRLAGDIPGAKAHILDGCGHLAPLDRPWEVAAVLSELATGAAAPSASGSGRGGSPA